MNYRNVLEEFREIIREVRVEKIPTRMPQMSAK
jgi:hypothetical protein